MTFDPEKPWAGMVPTNSIARNPGQPRTHFPKAELKALAVSMNAGQAQPCTVIPHTDAKRPQVKWMLVDGECRWRAATGSQIPELLVCYKPGVTKENLHQVSFASNFCRLSHTKQETARAVDKERERGLSYKEIGEMVGKTDVWAHNMHSLLKLHPELLTAIDEADSQTKRKLPMRVALLLAQQPHERQLKEWNRVKDLVSGEQYHSVRQRGVIGAGRSTRDDFTYLSGQLKQSAARLSTVENVGEVMMRRFNAEQLRELRGLLGELKRHADDFDARLEGYEHAAGEAARA